MVTTRLCWFFCYFICLFLCSTIIIDAQPSEYRTANLSSSWVNSVSAPNSFDFSDGSRIRVILGARTVPTYDADPRFACGFYCNGDCTSYHFAIYIVYRETVFNEQSSPQVNVQNYPQVVWSANRNNLVGINATLRLTLDGDLVLRDSDGTLAWSANTAGKKVAGLNMTEEGNLVMFGENGSTIWQSFDYPTDTLVLGQKLVSGNNLTTSVDSTTNKEGLITLYPTNNGLFASIGSDPPQVYYPYYIEGQGFEGRQSYVRFRNGGLAVFINSAEPGEPDSVIPIPQASSIQYMKLENDGHLRVYEFINTGWEIVADPMTDYIGECKYPMVCGKNGICTNGQCSCPASNYFQQINYRRPDLGCQEIVPLSCNSSQFHTFVELDDITYFTLPYVYNMDPNYRFEPESLEGCKEACLRNCSCKAAIFRYGTNSSAGNCYFPSKIFSFMKNEDKNIKAKAFAKVQILPNAESPSSTTGPTSSPTAKKTTRVGIILGSVLGSFFILFFVVGLGICVLKRRYGDADEEYLDQVPGLPTRFSYEDLKVATDNFSKKLGEGGFGSVFKGSLKDGTQVAVKCLEGFTQVKKSFIAEVETIGSIHHVNLVRLIGFCAEKLHGWILVYEYVSNGSLDRWIFRKSEAASLDWKCRKKVVLDIAKGLSYLHEECRQKIIHLDIKPQNILLDGNYDAKVADFGLAKLVDRNQSQVVTTMRGTPGYLAPEWLNSVITEKVDVYSFGVVVLEICCGRKNIDRSQPEEEMHLISLFQKRLEEGKLSDMIDSYSEDMRLNEAEVVEMMKLAAWCLQNDFAKRPSMSMVIKVMEGVLQVEENLDFGFLNPLPRRVFHKQNNTRLLASILSGPR